MRSDATVPTATQDGLEAIRDAAYQSVHGETPAPAAPESRWYRALFAQVGNFTAAALAIVCLSGGWLFFRYQPESVAGPVVQDQLAGGSDIAFSAMISDLHLVASWVFVGGAILWLVLWAVPRSRRVGLWSVPLIVLTVIAMITGRMIAWERLAVTVVGPRHSLRGATALFRDDVVFVIRDGAEASTSLTRVAAVSHVAAAVLIVGGLFALVQLFARTRR